MQVAQTAACNRLHDIEQRLSRWLLMTHDRADSGALPITHDFIATMMGTREANPKSRLCRFKQGSEIPVHSQDQSGQVLP